MDIVLTHILCILLLCPYIKTESSEENQIDSELDCKLQRSNTLNRGS